MIKPAKGKRQCNCKNKVVTRQIGPGMFQQYTTQECEECGNLQYVRQSDTITVTLEPGTPDGHVRPTLSRFQILLYLCIYSSTWFLSVPVNSWSIHDSNRTAQTGYITQGENQIFWAWGLIHILTILYTWARVSNEANSEQDTECESSTWKLLENDKNQLMFQATVQIHLSRHVRTFMLDIGLDTHKNNGLVASDLIYSDLVCPIIHYRTQIRRTLLRTCLEIDSFCLRR